MECRSCNRVIGIGESAEYGICATCRRSSGRPAGLSAGVIVFALGVRLMFAHGASGLAVMGIGVMVVVIALVLSATSSARQRHPQGIADDREAGPQVAGKTCPVCETKITSVFEGVTCDKCEAACHENCLGKHAIAAHGGSKKHPYRK